MESFKIIFRDGQKLQLNTDKIKYEEFIEWYKTALDESVFYLKTNRQHELGTFEDEYYIEKNKIAYIERTKFNPKPGIRLGKSSNSINKS